MTNEVSVCKRESKANREIERREANGWTLVDQEICRRVVHAQDIQFDDDYYVLLTFEKDDDEGGASE